MRTEDPIEQVKIAYADTQRSDNYVHKERCLSFCTSRLLDAAEATDAVDAIGGYNAFEPRNVENMISDIVEIDPDAGFAIAREGSPAIYVATDHPDEVWDVFSVTPSAAPDELFVGETAGSNFSREKFEEEGAEEAHWGCRHPVDEPPVEIDEWPDPDGRPVVRAWWD